jgi:hypothetical protein
MITRVGETMDITVRLSEKVVHRDSSGLYQTKEICFELSKQDVRVEDVRDVTVNLRLQVKKFIVNTKLKEGLITVEQGIEELSQYQDKEFPDGK